MRNRIVRKGRGIVQRELRRALLKNLLRYFGFPLAAAGVLLIAFFALQAQIVTEIRKSSYQILETAAQQQANALGRYLDLVATRLELITDYDAYQNPQALIESLQMELTDAGTDVSVGYANPMGELLTTDDSNGSKQNVASESWFKVSMLGKTCVTTVPSEQADGLMNLRISTPVNTAEGTRGVLFAMLSHESLLSQLKTRAYQGASFSFVCDASGVILFAESGARAIEAGKRVDAYLGEDALASGVSVESLRDAMRERNISAFHFSYQGQGYYAVTERMANRNWNMFTMVECKTADIIANQVRVYHVAMLLIILLVGVSMAAQAYEHERETVIKLESDKDLLKQSAQRYQLITRLSNEVFFHVTLDTGAISFNDTFESMFGFPAPNCSIDRMDHCSDLFFEDDRKIFLSLVNQLRAGEAEARAELRMVNSRGVARWKRVEIYTVFDLDKQAVQLVGKIADIHRQKQSMQRLIRQADSEPLTGLLNRGAMERNIKAFLSGEGLGGRHALIMLDFDNFKAVNDTLGHARGDQLLVSFANGIRRLFRSGDYTSRIGGDEYMLFIKNAGSDIVVQDKAEALRDEMAALSRKIGVPVSISVGIAVYERDGKTFEKLYKAADAALYAVKRGGKNAIAFHSASPDEAKESAAEREASAEGDELCDIDGMCEQDDEQE